MGWDYLSKLISRIRGQWAPRTDWRAAETIRSLLRENYPTKPRDVLALPAVWRAANIISNAIGQLPLHLYKLGESRERLDSGPFVAVMAHPSPGINGFNFRRTLTLHSLLTGNGFAAIIYRGKNPVRLLILDPEHTKPIEDGRQLMWVTEINGQQQEFSDEEVLHITGPSWTGLSGLSIVHQFSWLWMLQRFVGGFCRRFFERGLFTSGYLTSEAPISQEREAQLREAFRRMFFGEEGWEAPVLFGMEWHSTAVPLREAQLIELWQTLIREVGAIFGVPPHLLGDPSRTSYASLEQENLSFLQWGLEPWLRAWEEELNQKLASVGTYWEFTRSALVRTIFTERIRGYRALIEIGVLSPNEVRRMENLSAREGGDTYYVPANWIESGGGEASANTDNESGV